MFVIIQESNTFISNQISFISLVSNKGNCKRQNGGSCGFEFLSGAMCAGEVVAGGGLYKCFSE